MGWLFWIFLVLFVILVGILLSIIFMMGVARADRKLEQEAVENAIDELLKDESFK